MIRTRHVTHVQLTHSTGHQLVPSGYSQNEQIMLKGRSIKRCDYVERTVQNPKVGLLE